MVNCCFVSHYWVYICIATLSHHMILVPFHYFSHGLAARVVPIVSGII
jgi:hypothetical protein